MKRPANTTAAARPKGRGTRPHRASAGSLAARQPEAKNLPKSAPPHPEDLQLVHGRPLATLPSAPLFQAFRGGYIGPRGICLRYKATARQGDRPTGFTFFARSSSLNGCCCYVLTPSARVLKWRRP
jgi:hypothetical protein